MVIKWNTEKLNKYLSRIDAAIMQGRYDLALKLTNRLLKHYYRSFIRFKMPSENEVDNIRLMSVSISKYLVKYGTKSKTPHSEQRLLLIALVTNVLAVYTNNTPDEEGVEGKKSVIDKATATYVRKNVYSVIRYLGKYF